MALASATLALLALSGAAWAQPLIDLDSGRVNYYEDGTRLDGKWLLPGQFPRLEKSSLLETTGGPAEILLNPGCYLRLAENSAFRLLQVFPAWLEYVRGRALFQCEANFGWINVSVKSSRVALIEPGIYEIGGEPAVLKVYQGKARVVEDGRQRTVKKSRLLELGGTAATRKFDRKLESPLYQWAGRRSRELAEANNYIAPSVPGIGPSRPLNPSCWIWVPEYRTYTFLPAIGRVRNAFGAVYVSYDWVVNGAGRPDRMGISGDWDFSGRVGGDGRPASPAAAQAGRPR